MFKRLASSSMILLAITLVIVPVVSQASATADSVKNTSSIQKVSDLNMLTETGFEDNWDGTARIATFDDSSNTIVYQNGIPWFNPGGNIYKKNELDGVKKDGTKVKLTSGNVNGSSISGEVMNYTYRLNSAQKQDFTYYEVNVEYTDTIWGQTRSAHASFTLN